MTKFNSYNNTVTHFVITIETLLSGLLFLVLVRIFPDSCIENIMFAPKSQIGITIMLMYAISATISGVVLYKRKVYAYEIINRIVSAMVKFIILSFLMLEYGKYMNVLTLFYMTYILTLSTAVFMFRLFLRMCLKAYRTKGGNNRYVVLVGSSRSIAELYNELTEQKWSGFVVLGYFGFKKEDTMPEECRYLGKPEEVNRYLAENKNVHYLYCGLRDNYKNIIIDIIKFCENNMVRFYSIPNMNNYLRNKVFLENVGSVTVLSLREDRLSRTGNKVIKRGFDIVFSTLFLCTIFPIVLIAVTVITKITMPGPVFFKQKRNGLNGKEFYCLKFRSMKVNSDADKVQATKDDPRKTKWGNIMRKTNIDELPQFINVFLGDMSVVGPRPHMLKHTEEYSQLIDKYMVRHLVKPGVTGWSQVTGYRGETKELKDMIGRIKGDIWYIENWSFWLDMYIIYKTVANVVKGEEKAY